MSGTERESGEQVGAPSANRGNVFVSHANPEDNEFSAWLGSRLAGAGYTVWSDLLRLVGGEPFWQDIGEVIKNHAAVVVLVLSRSAIMKPGVLDEIALAVGTGRKLKNRNFVIPVRLDDLPYDEFPEQVIRLNAINFHGNWANGLHQLLQALEEHGIPRSECPSRQAIDALRAFRVRQTASLIPGPEIVEGSWLRIRSLPAHAVLCRYGAEPRIVAKQLRKFRTPIVPWDRLGFGFARASEIVDAEAPDLTVEHGYDLDLQAFLAGEDSGGPSLRRADARRMMVNLLRQSWERFAGDMGLRPYDFAHSTGWFVPLGLIENDKVRYEDRTGRQRWKRLVGRSLKRGVYWSFAVTIRPVVGKFWHFEIRPQVVFTEDGHTPVASKAKMARLRKSFCKNWWNDQWRTLLRAFLTHLSDENGELRLPLGGGCEAVLAAEMTAFEASMAIADDANIVAEEDVEESETSADVLDDGQDDNFFDEMDEEDGQ